LDYLSKNYGTIKKFWCGFAVTDDTFNNYIVRVIGGYGQGSGFFIAEDQVLTNFHVIADEPSPKIVFPGGKFTTPYKITGDKNNDLAFCILKKNIPKWFSNL
jgi:S1-C subfamily serine protease